MMGSPIRLAIALCSFAVLLGASTASAQGNPPRGGAGQGAGQQEVDQERLMERFLDLATTELNLSAEQRDQLGVVLQEASERRRGLGRRQMQLRRDISQALADPTTEASEFTRLAERFLTLQHEGLEIQEWQRDRVLEVLTPRQTLRFMLLQERLARRIQEMRRGQR